MSPEQSEGKPVDSRTDIFSLGILLYEMATGERPFQGDTPASLLSSILKDDPRPVDDLRPDLPVPLGEVLRGCLEKQPDARTSPARKVRDQLDRLRRQNEALRILVASEAPVLSERRRRRHLTAAVAGAVLVAALGTVIWQSGRRADPAPPVGVPAIAGRESAPEKIVVLPFENLGPAEDEYFAAGIAEEVTARLAAVGDLAVTSRQSARFYAGSDRTVAQIGQELGVHYVLEGTVRWERPQQGPSRMRITPQLIRVADDTHLWAEVYERDLAGIFALQSEIAERVVEELGVTLGRPEREAIQARPTDNLEAYQAYLRGRTFYGQVQSAVLGYRLALESYEQAVELDPDFALAYAELSRVHSQHYRTTMDPASAESARQNLERALGLAEEDLPRLPDDPEIHAMLGLIYAGLGRKEEAVRAGKRAVELRPTSQDAAQGPPYLRYLALIYARVGEHEAAIDELDRLLSIPFYRLSVPLLQLETWWDTLRAHPRYQALLRKHENVTERAPAG